MFYSSLFYFGSFHYLTACSLASPGTSLLRWFLLEVTRLPSCCIQWCFSFCSLFVLLKHVTLSVPPFLEFSFLFASLKLNSLGYFMYLFLWLSFLFLLTVSPPSPPAPVLSILESQVFLLTSLTLQVSLSKPWFLTCLELLVRHLHINIWLFCPQCQKLMNMFPFALWLSWLSYFCY